MKISNKYVLSLNAAYLGVNYFTYIINEKEFQNVITNPE